MNKAVQITCLVTIAAICLTTAAFSQTSVTLTGPPPGYVYDGIYMSPYYATVGGVTNVPVVCDDFGDDTYSGSTWNATVTSFSNLTPTTTSWGVAAASNTKLYGAAGYLFGQILSASTPYDKVVDTFELWALFDPGAVKNYLASTSVDAGAPISTSALSNLIFGTGSNAGLLASLLQQNLSASAYSNLIILSPDHSNGTICAAGEGKCAAQEFITFSVPEGGTAVTYLLLAGLCCAGAMWVRSRSASSRIIA